MDSGVSHITRRKMDSGVSHITQRKMDSGVSHITYHTTQDSFHASSKPIKKANISQVLCLRCNFGNNKIEITKLQVQGGRQNDIFTLLF